MAEITVPALLSHQQPIGESGARFKVLRCGRRFGKDVFAEHVSLLGHGPVMDEEPAWKGLVHGFDVVWLAPTIPQASAMWKNDVEPRFRGRAGIAVNRVEKTVTLLNPDGSAFSTLWVRSAEAIHSIRGIGSKLGGIVLNEAAHMDLQTAWRDVLRPTLMDCGGWAIFMSTTNAGPDGFEDEAGKRTPSFFNILCEEIQAKNRGPEWAEFYGTAQDNPKISQAEFDALVAEYPPDSPTLAQEVFAKLIIGGAGVAFPEWNDAVHIARYNPEQQDGFRWSGSGDWGWEHGVLHLNATGPERSLVRFEFSFRHLTPYEAGYQWGQQIMRFPRPEYMVVDTPAVSDGGPSILEELQRGTKDAVGAKQAVPYVNPPKGPGSRITKKALLHEALKYTRAADGKVGRFGLPKVQVHPDCVSLIKTLPRLPRDPKKPEDVDTTAFDHDYDSLCSWLMARTPHVERPKNENRDPDTHPGWNEQGARKDRVPAVAQSGSRWSRHAGVES